MNVKLNFGTQQNLIQVMITPVNMPLHLYSALSFMLRGKWNLYHWSELKIEINVSVTTSNKFIFVLFVQF